MKATAKAKGQLSSAEGSSNAEKARSSVASKIDPRDENFEHTLRRATLEKEKKRAENPGLYL